jgi:hypothetical protein
LPCSPQGEETMPTLHLHRQSAYLLGRDRKVRPGGMEIVIMEMIMMSKILHEPCMMPFMT